MDTPRIELRSKRLARLFNETWEQLPQADRRVILERLTLVSDHPGFYPKIMIRSKSKVAYAYGETGAYTVILHARRLAKQTDETVKRIIAHELGHVFCEHRTSEISALVSEDEAQERLTIWGFERKAV